MMFAIGLLCIAQASAVVQPVDAALPAETTVQTEAAPVILRRDTPVHLMVLNEVSTKEHEPGHRFKLRVNKPLMVDGLEAIPAGALAWGKLTDASKSGNAGKSGTLSAVLTHIEHDGMIIPIEGEASADGKSGKGETLLGVLAMGPLGLFAKGNNAKIKAGEKMVAFIAQDVVIDDAR